MPFFKMKLFDYLFYKIYKLINFLGNDDFYPEANTWLISSTFLWLNFLTVLNIVELILKQALSNQIFVIVLYILYMLLTYAYFFRKSRYKLILELYGQQNTVKSKWGTIGVAAYTFVTLVLHLYFSEERRAMALGSLG